jgi:hypothetical protein
MEKMSPRLIAGTAGVLYLLTIMAGISARGFVSERLVVSSDPAAWIGGNDLLACRFRRERRALAGWRGHYLKHH